MKSYGFGWKKKYEEKKNWLSGSMYNENWQCNECVCV